MGKISNEVAHSMALSRSGGVGFSSTDSGDDQQHSSGDGSDEGSESTLKTKSPMSPKRGIDAMSSGIGRQSSSVVGGLLSSLRRGSEILEYSERESSGPHLEGGRDSSSDDRITSSDTPGRSQSKLSMTTTVITS